MIRKVILALSLIAGMVVGYAVPAHAAGTGKGCYAWPNEVQRTGDVNQVTVGSPCRDINVRLPYNATGCVELYALTSAGRQAPVEVCARRKTGNGTWDRGWRVLARNATEGTMFYVFTVDNHIAGRTVIVRS